MKYFNALMVTRSFFAAITFLFSLAIASRSVAMSPAELAITGDWQIKVYLNKNGVTDSTYFDLIF